LGAIIEVSRRFRVITIRNSILEASVLTASGGTARDFKNLSDELSEQVIFGTPKVDDLITQAMGVPCTTKLDEQLT
jgi:hypothetical protein